MTDASKAHNHEIKCFKCQGFGHIASQCPNRRTMLLLENGEVVTDEEDSYKGVPSLGEKDADSSEEIPTNEQLDLVVQKVLTAQVKEENGQQRENIFYTRCHIKGKVCSLIIDPRSCTNVASMTLVEKASLPTIKHPHPYRLQ